MRYLVAGSLLCLIAATAFPCSTFCLTRDGEVVFGRNYDFEIGDGEVLVNKRGVQKVSYVGTLRWISRYGSVTFNQFGKEFPMDGMNEAGLVVALMWLDGTKYPNDDRPALTVLEWIQYQLDNFGTVEQLLANAEKVRISGATPLHYLVADATGTAATIEYLGGKLVVHTGASLPTANLTNNTYEDSLAYLHRLTGMPSGPGSLQRFGRTAMLMQTPSARLLRDQAFDILANVAQPGSTRWSVVYDTTAREVEWTALTSPSRKTLRFSDLDFSCATVMRMADVSTDVLTDYTAEANLELMLRSYAGTSFLRGVPREEIEADARHAESFSCAPPSKRTRAVRP